MAKKNVPLLDTQQEVAAHNHQLGTPIAWAAWLADQRRTPRERRVPDLHGHHLYPACLLVPGNQPLYAPEDLKAFVAAMRAADPGMRATRPGWFVVDDTPGIPWRMRRARRCIKLRARPSIVGAPRRPRPPADTPAAGGPAPI